MLIKHHVNFSGQGYPTTPGIYSKGQIKAWQKVTEAVHQKGGKIFLQTWHVGRLRWKDAVSSSATPLITTQMTDLDNLSKGVNNVVPEPPRALTIPEIKEIVKQFGQAAKNAKEAGFDGIEIHGANGYLVDQFLEDGVNKRTDEYGGSIEKRIRFMKEVTEASIEAWNGDASRVAIRLSPEGALYEMSDSTPKETWKQAVKTLDTYGLAYLHLMEPKSAANAFVAKELRPYFKGPLMINSGFTKETAEAILQSGDADLVSFGRPFVSNPDFVERTLKDQPLTPTDYSTLYYSPNVTGGYTDYKRFDEQYERYLKQKVYYNLIQESDVPKLMKAFKKPIVVCKEQFLDLLVHVKKEKQQAQTLRRRREYLDTLTSKSETVIIHSLFFVFNFLALGMVGSLEMLRRTPVEERTMDKGLWWLPYATYPWYSIFALSGLFCLGAGINEFYKFKSRSETIAVGIAFTIWSLILWIFTGFKYRMYSLAGMELSYWQDKIFPRSNIFLCFPFYAIGAFADAIIYSEYVHQHMYRKSTFPYFGCNINWGNLDKERATVFSCFSLCLTSLGLFSFTNLAPVFSFLPMVTAGAVAGSYMLSRYSDTDTRVVSGLPFGAALSLGILSLEHYSGLTFAPVATALLVMSGYFGYKHWFGKYY